LGLLKFNQEEMQVETVDGGNIQSNGRTKYLESTFVCEIFFFDFVVFCFEALGCCFGFLEGYFN
jgi:hypothetical protein